MDTKRIENNLKSPPSSLIIMTGRAKTIIPSDIIKQYKYIQNITFCICLNDLVPCTACLRVKLYDKHFESTLHCNVTCTHGGCLNNAFCKPIQD